MEESKIGMLPGSIVYKGNNAVKTANITVIYYDKTTYKKEEFTSYKDVSIDDTFSGNIWINVDSISDIEAVKSIGKRYSIDSLSLEDIVTPEQRVKIELKDEYILTTIKMLSKDETNTHINYEQLSIVVRDNVLITFQEVTQDFFGGVREKIESKKTNINENGVSYLSYILIDRIVDHYLLILDDIEDSIDEMEYKVINDSKREYLNDILYLKQNMNILKKFISPVRELVSKMQTMEMINYFPKYMKYYLSDLNDHIIIGVDSVNILNTRVTELIQLYHSTMSNNMNEIMKTLTIISTIFMPLSFVTGLYGMNFVDMPELKWKYGYPFAWAIMLLIIFFMIRYFKKKKWL